jgi:hypothetical protein
MRSAQERIRHSSSSSMEAFLHDMFESVGEAVGYGVAKLKDLFK